MRAAKWNERLSSREGVEAELGISVDALRRIETGVNKVIPVDSAVLLADLYNEPSLLNYYCLNECPIGKDRALSYETHGIDRVTVKLLKRTKLDELMKVRQKLMDIAEDGMVSDDEVDELNDVLEYFKKIQETVSELETICKKVVKRRESNG